MLYGDCRHGAQNELSDIKMPASKLELLVKMLRRQISEYSRTNRMAARKFQEMLEETIRQYHERRRHLAAEEAGAAQEETSEEMIQDATEQALQLLKEMCADRESFRKIGLTFEEKAFYFHDLRHTFSTHALASGVDAKTLASILGHTKASFTLDTYTHTAGDMQKRAADIVGSFLTDYLGEEMEPWQNEENAVTAASV